MKLRNTTRRSRIFRGKREGMAVPGASTLPYLHTAILSCLLCYLPAARAAEPGAMESWSNGASLKGWQRLDTIGGFNGKLTNPGGCVRAEFRAQSMAMPGVDFVYADGSASSGRFVGDYAAAEITSVRLSLYCETTVPPQARLYLWSGTAPHRWYYPLSGLVAGEWASFDVPLSYSAGWRRQGGTRTEFAQDFNSISRIGVRLQRSGSSVEAYRLDNFELVAGPLGSNELPDAWLVEHFGTVEPPDIDGVPLALQDSDGDGLSNWGEYRAGTDPNNAGSVFAVDLADADKAQTESVVLTWSSVPNRSYTVLRTDNLVAGFSVLETNVVATPPVNTYEDRTVVDGAYFYKIMIE